MCNKLSHQVQMFECNGANCCYKQFLVSLNDNDNDNDKDNEIDLFRHQ